MIDIGRYGIILHVQNYDACVGFYREKLGLPIELEKNEPGQVLTLFSLGDAYLMVEPGGMAAGRRKTSAENPVTLRLNTLSVESAAQLLRRQGVEVAVQAFDWGAIGDFLDPDGNRCQLRSAGDFGR